MGPDVQSSPTLPQISNFSAQLDNLTTGNHSLLLIVSCYSVYDSHQSVNWHMTDTLWFNATQKLTFTVNDSTVFLTPSPTQIPTSKFILPTPSPSPTLIVSPMITPTESPTQTPTIEPSAAPSSTQENFTQVLVIVGIVVVIVAVVAGALLYFKKRKALN